MFNFEPNERFFLHLRESLFEPLPLMEVLALDFSYQRIDDDRRTRDFGSTEEFRERNNSQSAGATLQAQTRWSEMFSSTYGAEVYLDTVSSSRTATDIDTGERRPAAARFADGSTMDSYGVYLQNDIELHPRLLATLGIRVSHYDIDIPAADRGIGTHKDLTDVTGSGALSYLLTPSINLVANAGRGFRAPNVFDLSTLGPRPGNRFNVPNDDLGAEEAVSVDFGVKVENERFAGQLFGFYTDLDDRIEALPTGETTPDGREIVRNENITEAELYGLEGDGSLWLTDDLRLRTVLNFTWGEQQLPGGPTEPADRVPPVNGVVALRYDLAPDLWLEPYVVWAGPQDRLSQRDKDDPRIDPSGTDGWATINLRAGWSPYSRLRLVTSLENLADESYRWHGSGVDAPGINFLLSAIVRL